MWTQSQTGSITIANPSAPPTLPLRERLTRVRAGLFQCLGLTEAIQDVFEPRPTGSDGKGVEGPMGMDGLTNDLERLVGLLGERLQNIQSRIG